VKLRTWHFENAVVVAVLLLVWVVTGMKPIELFGSVAVFCGHVCTSMGDRMTEKDAAREKPSVPCARHYWYFFVVKELCWLTYFALKGAWSAIAGVGIALGYIAWRKLWRSYHPMSVEP
jgi:hypothetical protein